MAKSLFGVETEIAVITGAAGQLGFQYAKAFVEAGARVAALDVKPSSQLEVLQKASGGRLAQITCDITSPDSLRAALRATRAELGEPTVLVNNAAIDSPPDAPIEETGPFESYPDTSWDSVMEVNVKGPYLACKVFGTAMAANTRGSIINVASIYGIVSPDQSIYEYRRRRGEPFYKPVAYSVSKSAVLNLTRYLAVYWARAGVRVNTLVIAGVQRGQDKEFLAAYNGRIPVGRMAAEDEYNGAVLFLASPASAYMTGSQLVVDGGWTAI